ncbi:MAG: lysophospholipid acyltransferase family protein [Anaerolineae bacterium]
MQGVLKAIVRVLTPLLMRVEVVGRENFPDQGPYIAVTNHLSVFDTAVLLIVSPHKVRALGAAKHKYNPIYGPILAMAEVIWVQRGEVDRQALRQALRVLQQGGVLGLAPEGTRARGDYCLQRAKTGVAYLATRADVPILPVGLSGTEKVKYNLTRLRRTDVRVAIGEPFRLPESGRVRGRQLREYTDMAMYRIAALLPEEYRGVYAE